MPLYESKGKQWAKSKPTYPIGLDPKYLVAPEKSTSKKIPGLSFKEMEVAPKSSKKKRKKKNDSQKIENLSNKVANIDLSSKALKDSNSLNSENSTKSSQPVTTDPAKRLRNLKKKLRDINALKVKIESGELTNPDKDQLEKVARKEEIEAEIESLELELEIS